jgi:hypothetical protein
MQTRCKYGIIPRKKNMQSQLNGLNTYGSATAHIFAFEPV